MSADLWVFVLMSLLSDNIVPVRESKEVEYWSYDPHAPSSGCEHGGPGSNEVKPTLLKKNVYRCECGNWMEATDEFCSACGKEDPTGSAKTLNAIAKERFNNACLKKIAMEEDQ